VSGPGGLVDTPVSPAKPWPAFQWDDPMLLETAFTDEERMVRDTARSFAEQHLAPIVKLARSA